jgi:hypothetical protein
LAKKGLGFDPKKLLKISCEKALSWVVKQKWAVVSTEEMYRIEIKRKLHPLLALMNVTPRDGLHEVKKYVLREMDRLIEETLDEQSKSREELDTKVDEMMKKALNVLNLHKTSKEYAGKTRELLKKMGLTIEQFEKRTGLSKGEYLLAQHYLNEGFSRDLQMLKERNITIADIGKRWPEIQFKCDPQRYQEDGWPEILYTNPIPMIKPRKRARGPKVILAGRILLLCWEERKALWRGSKRHFADACDAVGLPNHRTIREQRNRLEKQIAELGQTTHN